MGTDEMTPTTVDAADLLRGQDVHVRVGGHDLGEGVVDDITEDGSIVWVVFRGPEPRRMFLEEDRARYRVIPPSSLR